MSLNANSLTTDAALLILTASFCCQAAKHYTVTVNVSLHIFTFMPLRLNQGLCQLYALWYSGWNFPNSFSSLHVLLFPFFFFNHNILSVFIISLAPWNWDFEIVSSLSSYYHTCALHCVHGILANTCMQPPLVYCHSYLHVLCAAAAECICKSIHWHIDDLEKEKSCCLLEYIYFSEAMVTKLYVYDFRQLFFGVLHVALKRSWKCSPQVQE